MAATPRPIEQSGAIDIDHAREPLARRFTHRYVAAIVLFTLLALATKISIDSSSRRASDLAAQSAAISAQVRRLDQVVDLASKVALQAEESQPFQYQTWSNELRQRAGQLRDVEDALAGTRASADLPDASLSPELASVHTGPDRLQPLISEISETALAIAVPPDGRLRDRTDLTNLFAVITRDQEPARTALDKAAELYSAATQEAVSYTHLTLPTILRV